MPSVVTLDPWSETDHALLAALNGDPAQMAHVGGPDARFQGRGVASAATRQALAVAREADGPRVVHAFPGVENAPSNAVCREAGFALLGEVSFEYPPGAWMTVNDWRLDL